MIGEYCHSVLNETSAALPSTPLPLAAHFGANLLALRFSSSEASKLDAPHPVISARACDTMWRSIDGGEWWQVGARVPDHNPTNAGRINDFESRMARVLPMYEAAAKPERKFGPPTERRPTAPTTQFAGRDALCGRMVIHQNRDDAGRRINRSSGMAMDELQT